MCHDDYVHEIDYELIPNVAKLLVTQWCAIFVFNEMWDYAMFFSFFFPFWTWPFDACFELDSPWIGGANIFGKTHIWREAVLYHHSCILKLLFIDWSCTHKRTYCSQLVSHVNSPTKFWARIVGSNGMFVIIFV